MVLDANRFQHNTASNKGGAVFLANKNFTLPSKFKNNNTFHDNKAVYGNITAYAPYKLEINHQFQRPEAKIEEMFGRRLDHKDYFWQIASGG